MNELEFTNKISELLDGTFRLIYDGSTLSNAKIEPFIEVYCSNEPGFRVTLENGDAFDTRIQQVSGRATLGPSITGNVFKKVL